jgi:UDP-2,3-diacylglucosamine pyrophosphatase LpxH
MEEIVKPQERAIVFGDTHMPFHDQRLLDLISRFLQDFKPDTFIHGGDLIDCWELSDFDKNPKDESRFSKELKRGEGFWYDMRHEFPKAHLVYLYGNHEYRLQKYIIRHAAALAGLPELSLEALMHLDKYDVEIANSGLKESFYWYGKLAVSHFNKVSQHGGYTAKQLVDKYMVSVLHGHTHRVGSNLRTTLDGQILGGWDNGCTCNLHPTYVLSPNWQHAISVVYKWTDGRFQVIQIPIIKYKFRFGDKEYVG